ncbi:MAG: GNAT family N-acetyltransferase [Acidobacteriia bacterium]|nr:GNAT family N-acetyltransferase [Terriglobia bacterium]
MTQVRLLTEADIPACVRLKDAAGWNQTATDWRNVMALAPDGCFGMDCDGELRATTTAVCFGQELAWVGMVLTDSAYRRRGFARRLMEHALEYLRRRSVGWIKLDATEMGAPLYERLGFREEGGIERWIRPRGVVPDGPSSAGLFALDAALDREAFGADRSPLLHMLAGIESASVAGAGFAMGRPGAQAAYFGPCVARSADVARDFVTWFLRRHPDEDVCWDILTANAAAVRMARELGFERRRELVRMALSGVNHVPALKKSDHLVFAPAGFEFG